MKLTTAQAKLVAEVLTGEVENRVSGIGWGTEPDDVLEEFEQRFLSQRMLDRF